MCVFLFYFRESQGHRNLQPPVAAVEPSVCSFLAQTDVDITSQFRPASYFGSQGFRFTRPISPFVSGHTHTHSHRVSECWDCRPSLNGDGGGTRPAVPLLAMETAPGLQPPCCQKKLKKSCCCHGDLHHLTYPAVVAPLWVGAHDMCIFVEKI